jgi:hypothetical protein
MNLFSVLYNSVGGIPTDAQFGEADEVTIMHIDAYLRGQLRFVPDIIFLEFVGTGIRNEVGPLKISFEGMAIFDEIGNSLSREEMDILISNAFQQPNVAPLLSMLQALPDANPFSSTTSVVYMNESLQSILGLGTEPESSGSTRIPAAAIVATAGAAFLAFLFAGLIYTKRQRNQDPLKKYRPAARAPTPDIEFGEEIDAVLEAEESVGTSCTGPIGRYSYDQSSDDLDPDGLSSESEMAKISSIRCRLFKNRFTRRFRKQYMQTPTASLPDQEAEDLDQNETDCTSSVGAASALHHHGDVMAEEEETEIEFSEADDDSLKGALLFKNPFFSSRNDPPADR